VARRVLESIIGFDVPQDDFDLQRIGMFQKMLSLIDLFEIPCFRTFTTIKIACKLDQTTTVRAAQCCQIGFGIGKSFNILDLF
jgi:hypothetical protein